jgi:hypothetical protein
LRSSLQRQLPPRRVSPANMLAAIPADWSSNGNDKWAREAYAECLAAEGRAACANHLSAHLADAREHTCSRSVETPESRVSVTIHWRCVPRPTTDSHSRSGESATLIQQEWADGQAETLDARATSNPLGANGSASADEPQPARRANRKIATAKSERYVWPDRSVAASRRARCSASCRRKNKFSAWID